MEAESCFKAPGEPVPECVSRSVGSCHFLTVSEAQDDREIGVIRSRETRTNSQGKGGSTYSCVGRFADVCPLPVPQRKTDCVCCTDRESARSDKETVQLPM